MALYEGYEGYLTVSSWCLHCCTNIILSNDKLHLIQTTISHILRASGQSLHSYKDDDYHYYLVQMTHIWPIPCSYKIIFFVMFDNVYTLNTLIIIYYIT